MTEMVFIPFPKELYDDLVRFSDGKANVPYWAAERVRTSIEWALDNDEIDHIEEWCWELFGDRIYEVAEKYAPHVLERWRSQENTELGEFDASRNPLVWKEITVPANSAVRMSYGGDYHYAKVHNAKIVDEDGAFSPSEWAYKVANQTSRNAWRDLWFRESSSSEWMPAQLLREKALAARRALLSGVEGEGEAR